MFIERRENKIVDEFDTMTEKQIEAWLDERAEARVKARQLRESPDVRRRMHRGRCLLAASGRRDRRRRRASLTDSPMVGKGADGPATEMGRRSRNL
jgi:hypothetical protein